MNCPFVMFVRFTVGLAGLALLSSFAVGAQPGEELELKNGRRIPVSSVKVAPEGFSAPVTHGNTVQIVIFTAKDVVRANFREPPELSAARASIANGKADEAVKQLAELSEKLAPFQTVPGSWWHRAAILHMDALVAQGKTREALALVSPAAIAELPENAAGLIADYQVILGKPGGSSGAPAGAEPIAAEAKPEESKPEEAKAEAGKTAEAKPPEAEPAAKPADKPGEAKAPGAKPGEKAEDAKTPEIKADPKIAELEALAKRCSDPWITARAWLEVGNVFASRNQTEDAVKAWLRVFVFHGAEKDLAVRGLVAAARGLQQLKLAEDGFKLLDDYHTDHIGSAYSSLIRAEMTKLDPKQQQR